MIKHFKKIALHVLIVGATTLFWGQSCLSKMDRPAKLTASSDHILLPADARVFTQSFPTGGMTYLIVATPAGVTLANVTKDSLEVLLRKRNELYLELANRQFSKK